MRIGHLSRTDRDAILRYISPPPHCVCIHNRTCRINWRHASATVTSCPFYFRVTNTHTQIGRGPLSQTASTPNANKDTSPGGRTTKQQQSFNRSDGCFPSGSEPRAHIVCEMFPHGKEKKDTTKNPNIPAVVAEYSGSLHSLPTAQWNRQWEKIRK